MIAADGRLGAPAPDARPLPVAAPALPVTFENPPGLYGAEDGVVAHNLLAADASFTPIAEPQVAMPVSDIRYAFDELRDLKGPLVAAALALMVLDTLAVFWIGGVLARRPRLVAARRSDRRGDPCGAARPARRRPPGPRMPSRETRRPSTRSPSPTSPMC